MTLTRENRHRGTLRCCPLSLYSAVLTFLSRFLALLSLVLCPRWDGRSIVLVILDAVNAITSLATQRHATQRAAVGPNGNRP